MIVSIVLVHNPFNIKRPITWLAALIRKVTRRHYNHSAMLFDVEDRVYVIEAIYPRVIIREFNKWIKSDPQREYKLVPRTIDDYPSFVEKVLSQVGKEYDIMSLVFYLPISIIFKRWVGRKKQIASRKLYCYELVAYLLDEDNYYKVNPNE